MYMYMYIYIYIRMAKKNFGGERKCSEFLGIKKTSKFREFRKLCEVQVHFKIVVETWRGSTIFEWCIHIIYSIYINLYHTYIIYKKPGAFHESINPQKKR